MDRRVLKTYWDRIAAVALAVAAAVCFFAGYRGVADSVLVAEQTRYIVAGGIGGILLTVLGATLWISADLRDEWRKLDRIEHALGEGVLTWVDHTAGPRELREVGPTNPNADVIAHSSTAQSAGAVAADEAELARADGRIG